MNNEYCKIGTDVFHSNSTPTTFSYALCNKKKLNFQRFNVFVPIPHFLSNRKKNDLQYLSKNRTHI